jgi:hypothetical protein
MSLAEPNAAHEQSGSRDHEPGCGGIGPACNRGEETCDVTLRVIGPGRERQAATRWDLDRDSRELHRLAWESLINSQNVACYLHFVEILDWRWSAGVKWRADFIFIFTPWKLSTGISFDQREIVMHISMSEVPMKARRLAANHLASLRDTEMIAGAEEARLGPDVVPIYRPDLDGVAYYEFAIIGPGGRKSRVLTTAGYTSDARCEGSDEDAVQSRHAVGFIVVTNGTHDFPISHWSVHDTPPSVQALNDPSEQCESKDKEIERAAPSRIYRLDALSYVIEDDKGEIVGSYGQMPGLISGLPHDLMRFLGAISSAITQPFRDPRDDAAAGEVEHEVDVEGPQPPELRLYDDVSWREYKARYSDSFGPLLDRLRHEAAEFWEVEELIARFGEGIEVGTTHRIDLLDHACIELSGEGRDYVRPVLQDAIGKPLTLSLHVPPATLKHELDLNVSLRYRNGESERLKFFIVSQDVPSNTRAELEQNLDRDCEGD